MSTRKYLAIFNRQTIIVSSIAFISSVICLYFKLAFSLDFIILDLTIFFPLTFTLQAAFRRRERALQYLSLFKGSLQSVYYAFQNAKIEPAKKLEFEHVANNISNKLSQYLLYGTDALTVQELSHAVFDFINHNKKDLKRALSSKILLFIFRLNESIEFLIATKRHRTPWGVRAIVLFSIYGFVIFYPAAILYEKSFSVDIWYVFFGTEFKALLLITLYNIQDLLEDPFNQRGTDGIRLGDFKFSPSRSPLPESSVVTILSTMPDHMNRDLKNE